VKKLSRRTWIIIGIIVLILAIASAANANKSGDTPTAAAPTPIIVNSQATDTPIPPTPTSSALTDKAAIKTQLQSDISNLALVGDTVNVDYGDHAVVLVGENQRPDEGYLVAMVQSECYDVQKAVWQDPLLQKVNWLDFSVFTVDSQGLPVVLGECILHAQKAGSIQWDNYDATSAWQQKIYENMLLK